MQDTIQFKAGDKVRHDTRPEWGIGVIHRAEPMTVGGKQAQRLMVRFPNAGLKTLSTVGAPLRLVPAEDAAVVDADGHTLRDREEAGEGGWLGEISKSKPEDAMTALPPDVIDPFSTLEARLSRTLDLFRFELGGASLIDWAVARSGLDDPLSRFTRQELEQFFERWSFLRDQHLVRLGIEAKGEPGLMKRLLANAPPSAKRAASRRNGGR